MLLIIIIEAFNYARIFAARDDCYLWLHKMSESMNKFRHDIWAWHGLNFKISIASFLMTLVADIETHFVVVMIAITAGVLSLKLRSEIVLSFKLSYVIAYWYSISQKMSQGIKDAECSKIKFREILTKNFLNLIQ